MLLVQFLVLAFTGALWWLARRDLASRAAPPPPVDTQELEQLCATLEALVTDLSRRLAAMEQRLHKDIGAPPAAPVDYPSLSSIGVGGIGNNGVRPPLPFSVSPPEPQAEPENASHAALYAAAGRRRDRPR